MLHLDHVAAQRLVAQLPTVLQINDFDDDGWLDTTLRLISREAQSRQPGGETVVTRLADILVIQAIRSWLESAPQARQGWLAALRDEHVGRALASIHRTPERNWSVALLARQVGMSRSAFSARFTDLVGESAMRYVTNWRLQLARAHLRDSSEPLSAVARRFGYQSEPAFCRAFKRTFGVPPGSVRQTATTSATGAAGPILTHPT